jgi:hypothetical protein
MEPTLETRERISALARASDDAYDELAAAAAAAHSAGCSLRVLAELTGTDIDGVTSLLEHGRSDEGQ